MQNDLIVIEFSNGPDTETLLDPWIVPQCADTLRVILEGLVRLSGTVPTDVELSLAAVARGSVKLGFKPRLGGKRFLDKDRVGVTADTLTIVQIVGPALIYALVAAGVVSPADSGTPKPDEKSISLQISIQAMHDQAVMDGIDKLVSVVEKSGASHISISVPDAPLCVFIPDRSKDATLIGSKSVNPVSSHIPFFGTLNLTARKFERRESVGIDKHLYYGTINIDGQDRKVLVDWRSQKPIPFGPEFMGGHGITVRGSVMPFSYIGESSSQELFIPVSGEQITHDLKIIDGILIVEKQVVEE